MLEFLQLLKVPLCPHVWKTINFLYRVVARKKNELRKHCFLLVLQKAAAHLQTNCSCLEKVRFLSIMHDQYYCLFKYQKVTADA